MIAFVAIPKFSVAQWGWNYSSVGWHTFLNTTGFCILCPPTPGPYDVTVNTHLGVNTNSTYWMFGGAAPIDYPLVVNGTIALLENTADGMRNIEGLTNLSGVSIFSGDGTNTGSGLILNANHSLSYARGAVQSISNTTFAGLGSLALEHLDYNAAGVGSSLYRLYNNGNVSITGKLTFDMLGGDIAQRRIEGLSSNFGLDIMSGPDILTADDGTKIHITAPNNILEPGRIQFFAVGGYYAALAGTDLAYIFKTKLPPSLGSGLTNALTIDNKGTSRFGDVGVPGIERLTIDGDIFINSFDGVDNYRNVFAKSTSSGINFSAGTATDGSNGACYTAFANSSVIAPEVYPGAFVVRSNGAPSTPGVPPLGFAYKNWDPTLPSGIHNNFLISKGGLGIIGKDVDLSNIVNSDVLTIKDKLGFWDASDAASRYINGETNTGKLVISSLNGSDNSASIELMGPSAAGEVHVISYGTTGNGTKIENYDPGTGLWHNNVVVGNNGQTTVGQDIDVTVAAPGDILTVKDQLGFYDAIDATIRHINGNTVTGSLQLAADVNQNNGGVIKMHGSGDGGGIQYFANGTTDYGHKFINVDAGGLWHNRMAITNDGKVLIGEDIIDGYLMPNNYNLYVQNGIMTEHVRVAIYTTSDWSDKVFDKDYDLISISKLAKYIDKHKHLPDLPSAKEVVKDGIDLGKMDALLLQKIEELTLYALQQQKQIDELSAKLEILTLK